jgi:hypothetical protein
VEPLAEGVEVGVADGGVLRELRLGPSLGVGHGAAVEPEREPEREHVLGLVGLLRRELELSEGLAREAGELDGEELVARERAVVERVHGVPRQFEAALVERVDVDEHRRPLAHAVEVHLQRGGVHRHEEVHLVAGRVDRPEPKWSW